MDKGIKGTWDVGVAVSSSAYNGLVSVGGVTWIKVKGRVDVRSETFFISLGLRNKQNLYLGELAVMLYTLRILLNIRCRRIALLTTYKVIALSL